ncbi:MAG: BCCT family transporter, partial [Planctomycetota bacterium]
MQNPFRGLRPLVFWPPFLLLLLVVALHWIAPESFPETLDVAKSFVIEFFGWLFSLTALAAVLICVYVCFSKFRHVKLGGPDAQPIMPM